MHTKFSKQIIFDFRESFKVHNLFLFPSGLFAAPIGNLRGDLFLVGINGVNVLRVQVAQRRGGARNTRVERGNAGICLFHGGCEDWRRHERSPHE